jgi:hypothetical protein
MFSKLKAMFSDSQPEEKGPDVPEVLGLKLGGSFTIDPMLLKTMEDELTIEGASSTQIIQSVGVVQIDDQNRLIRYYTDDEGFLQILQYGTDDSGISEIGLWYFFDAKPISEASWESVLKKEIVAESGQYTLDGQQFDKFWEDDAPVPMVEKTYHKAGKISETTQFGMSYTRPLSNNEVEMLLVTAEERVNKVHNTLERERVRSTGFSVGSIDITSN